MICFRYFLIVSVLYLCFSTGVVFAHDSAHDHEHKNECPYDVCENRCDWEKLKASYATQQMKDYFEQQELSASKAGVPVLRFETCLVDEWLCKYGFERSESCGMVNPDKGMSVYVRRYGGPYGDDLEPVPTKIPDSKNKQNIYQNDCDSGAYIEGAELISGAGMNGYLSYSTAEYEQKGMPCRIRPCSHETFSANGYLRGDWLDLGMSGSQRFYSESCHNCSPNNQNEPDYGACVERFSKGHSENPVTSSPEEVKSMLISLASHMVSGSQALVNLSKTGQIPEPGDYGDTIDEESDEPVAIRVQGQAEGFSVFADTLFTEDFAPSEITLHGLVKDVSGARVPNAMVTLPDLGVSVQSGPDGSYRINASADGSQPFMARLDLVLKQEIRDVAGKVDADPLLYANGKAVRVWLHVMADGKPYKNKPVQVIQTSVFKVGERETDILTLPIATNEKIQTDEYGWATVTLYGPRVLLDRLSPSADSQWFFPANGFLELRGEWEPTKKVMVAYEVHNPFPVIRKLVIPGNIDEDSWQITPTRVYIDDPDSESVLEGEWHVTVEAVGSLKILHGSLTKGKIAGWTTASPFEFHYRPPKVGFDLQKQPELGKQLIETNLKVALAMFIGNFEDKRIPKGSNVEKAYNTAKNALTYLDRATDTTNLVTSDQTSSPGEAMIKGFDYVFAMTDTAFGLLGTPWCWKLELAKGAYENAKVFHAALLGYEKITNAYQDTVFMPLTVTVEDEMGHKTTKVGKCSVRIWKAL